MGIRSSPDRGLQVRMAVMSFFVVAANIVFATIVLEIFSIAVNVVFALLVLEVGRYFPALGLPTHASQIAGFEYDRLTVLSVTALFMLGQYWYIRRGVLRPAAVQTESPTSTDLEERITRLASQAAVPVPSMAVVTSPIPNCYTVGRRGNATIVVSTGLCETLNDEELDAVLAHELAHVLNHDVTVMTMAVAPFRLARSLVTTLDRMLHSIKEITFGILVLGQASVAIFGILAVVLVGFRRVYDWIVTVAPFVDPGPILGFEILPSIGDVFFGTVIDYVVGLATLLLMGGLLLIPVVLALSVYYAILGVVPRRLSIYREYAADRGAAMLTGNPAAVATALETLATATERPPTDRRQATEIQALCLISDGIGDEIAVGPIRQSIADDHPLIEAVLQSIPTGIVAHPPLEDRIKRLQAQQWEIKGQ